MVNLERSTEMIDASGSKMTGLAEIHPWRLFAGSYEKFDFAVFGSSVTIPIARELLGALREYHSGCNLCDDVVLDAERCAAGDPALERSTRPGRSTVVLADLT
jgi:hypothetical protein